MPLKLKYTVHAHALTITLVIGVVLGILTTSALLIAYHSQRAAKQFAINLALQSHLESSINYILHDTALNGFPKQELLELNAGPNDSVCIKRDFWGIYQFATVTVKRGAFSKQKNFLYGAMLPDFMNGCIYLADHHRALSLVGSTRLKGDAYLAKAGLLAGYIDGRGYENARLIEGEVKASKPLLPALHEVLTTHLISLFETKTGNITFGTLQLTDSTDHSFNKQTLYTSDHRPLYIDHIRLTGKILIRSDVMIEVGAECHLENAILVAPVIRFKQGFVGSLQAFATDSLIVESGCEFHYPSALVLLKKPEMTRDPVIQIGEDCSIDGYVMTLDRGDNTRKPVMSLGSKTQVNGVIYSDGYLSLNANVNGIVLTDYFTHQTPAGLYENYLINIAIDRAGLSQHFVGMPGFGSRSLKVAVWLD